MSRKLYIGIVVIVVAAGALFLGLRKDNPVKFKTEPVSRGTIRAFCTATGTVAKLVCDSAMSSAVMLWKSGLM